jgi:3-isopropylmalate dehydratase small subunit
VPFQNSIYTDHIIIYQELNQITSKNCKPEIFDTLDMDFFLQVKHGVGVEEIVGHILQAWEVATGNKGH